VAKNATAAHPNPRRSAAVSGPGTAAAHRAILDGSRRIGRSPGRQRLPSQCAVGRTTAGALAFRREPRQGRPPPRFLAAS
jgi:hypothetical protein